MRQVNFGVSRRDFLNGLAVAGAGALLPTERFFSQSKSSAAASTTIRIDLQYHIVPPSLLQTVGAQRLGGPSANWTPERAIEAMDQAGVSTGISSIAPAGDPFSDRAAAVRLCRECNEYAARLVTEHKRRFGIFA